MTRALYFLQNPKTGSWGTRVHIYGDCISGRESIRVKYAENPICKRCLKREGELERKVRVK